MDPTVFKFYEILATAIVTGSTGLMVGLYKARREASHALAEAARNATPQDIIDLLEDIKRATVANSPGGEDITDAEALALGLLVWKAFHK